MKSRSHEIAVVGGGLVGMAIAYGLLRLGHQVSLFDEGDAAFRASRGNFGLIWVQSKGVHMPLYARWTRRSAALWPELAAELQDVTGQDLQLQQQGGLDICLTEEEAEQRTAPLNRLREALDGDYPFEFLGHNALRKRLPEIGPDVAGAIFCAEDGHVNPLYLLRAFYAAFQQQGGCLINDASVMDIQPANGGFVLNNGQTHEAEKVVLCAGLGNVALAAKLGLQAPLSPQRGQIIITERTPPFLRYPTSEIRQVAEGAIQIGASHEEVGLNDNVDIQILAKIASRAVRILPCLRQLRMLRSWGALRILSPDGHPIYDSSKAFPGAYLVTCHSGVTLAAVHALVLAKWISAKVETDMVENFSAQRFALSKAG